jgi:hypothetical protein
MSIGQPFALDTASNMTLMNSQTPATYNFSTTGIAWPTDTKKYKPCGYQNSQIIPPPNWAPRYPNGRYTDEYPPPDLGKMERFMIWVHVTALPDFRKIWARNDHDDIQPGRWSISIDSSKLLLELYMI